MRTPTHKPDSGRADVPGNKVVQICGLAAQTLAASHRNNLALLVLVRCNALPILRLLHSKANDAPELRDTHALFQWVGYTRDRTKETN